MSGLQRFSLRSLVVDGSRSLKTDVGITVWNLNLDQIESDTGRVLTKQMVAVEKLGPSTYPFEAGTVLYSKLRPYLNKVVVAEDDGVATTELVPLRCHPEKLLPHYLAYYLRSAEFLEFANTVVAGAKMPRMVMSEFWEYKIPVPPIPEQRFIAAILDQADSLRVKRREALAQLDSLTQSIFIEMFGDPVSNPKGWDMVKLGDHTLKMGSGSTPTGGDAAYKESGISLIRSLNVHDGKFRYKNLAFIDEQQASKLANVKVAEGDVLLNITGASVARVCLAPKNVLPARVNQHVMIIRPKPTIDSIFLEQMLLSHTMKKNLLQIGAGATRESITKAQAEELNVICPPISLQQKFSKRIASVGGIRLSQAASLNELETLFASLQHRAFRGEL